MEKQAFPPLPEFFFYPFHGRDHAGRDRPAARLDGCARGDAPFCCGKTSGIFRMKKTPLHFCNSVFICKL